LAQLPVHVSLKRLVRISKHRWVIERDYEELKQELGLVHYEGRNWRGFHHHATMCIAACGVPGGGAEPFFPSARIGRLAFRLVRLPAEFRPRGSKGSRPAA
jgi:SRSO17 transposase